VNGLGGGKNKYKKTSISTLKGAGAGRGGQKAAEVKQGTGGIQHDWLEKGGDVKAV